MDFLTSAIIRTDPIVSPGELSAHIHTFFGAAVANSDMTYEDMRNAKGNSGNVEENKSVYWYPTIYRYDRKKKLYFVADIWHHSSYYAWHPGSTRAFPDAFKMVVYADVSECVTEQGEDEEGEPVDDIMKYVCGKSQAECVQPGKCPDDNCETLNEFFPPTSCAELEISFEFPDCWDGKSLDSSDHRAHVSYENPETDECPTSHPVRIPKIWVFTRIKDYPGGQHLFSDGSGAFHSDYFSGWNEKQLQYVLDNCETYSYGPNPDSFCDKESFGDERFLTYVDSPKDGKENDRDIAEALRELGVTEMIDTSDITNEKIDGVAILPGNPLSVQVTARTESPVQRMETTMTTEKQPAIETSEVAQRKIEKGAKNHASKYTLVFVVMITYIHIV